MEAIKETIKQLMQGLAEKKTGQGQDNPEEWIKKTLTKKELGHIKFNYFRRGVFCIQVDSSSRLYSLSLRKDALLKRLKGYSSGIKELRIRLGEIK